MFFDKCSPGITAGHIIFVSSTATIHFTSVKKVFAKPIPHVHSIKLIVWTVFSQCTKASLFIILKVSIPLFPHTPFVLISRGRTDLSQGPDLPSSLSNWPFSFRAHTSILPSLLLFPLFFSYLFSQAPLSSLLIKSLCVCVCACTCARVRVCFCAGTCLCMLVYARLSVHIRLQY